MTGMLSNSTTYHLPPGAAEWLRRGLPCPSALYVVEHLTGLPLLNVHIYPTKRPHPRSAQEIFLIETLLDQVPEFRARFPELAKASKPWAAVIAAWDGLLASLQDELRHGQQLAPLTTRKLASLTA